jgi:hypothetical protein
MGLASLKAVTPKREAEVVIGTGYSLLRGLMFKTVRALG